MNNKKCLTCAERKRCRDSFVSWIFFIIGLIATIAIRVVVILTHINSIYGKISWYIGVGGFLLFFIYKFNINRTRSNLIEEKNILKKIEQKQQLFDKDYKFISEIFCSLSSKKERINYLFIFSLTSIKKYVILCMLENCGKGYPCVFAGGNGGLCQPHKKTPAFFMPMIP